MRHAHDPFSFLLSEIRAYDAGFRVSWDDCQRKLYLDVLLVDEAEELAWGRRHVTLVHGEPVDEIDAELLDELCAAWIRLARQAEWSRMGAVPGHHVTFSVAGADADELVAIAAHLAARANPGRWKILDAAVPTFV
jgi:hypothetical protein